jgi:flagellar basal body-associated protein FliL
MFCGYCGKQIKDDSAFCPYCGKTQKNAAEPVADSPTPKKPEPEVIAPTVEPVINTSPAEAEPAVINPPAPPISTPSAPPVPLTPPVQTAPKPSAPKSKKKPIVLIVVIVLGVLILAAGGFFAWCTVNDQNPLEYIKDRLAGGAEQTAIPSANPPEKETPTLPETDPSTPPVPPAPPAEPAPKPVFNVSVLDGIIAARTAASNIAVAIYDVNTRQEYATKNAGDFFVASGFYAPIYAAAYSAYNTNATLTTRATSMIVSMDNAAANAIIDGLGGMSATNEILSNLGYYTTTFNRRFGDTESSRLGYENYTSAMEAALILGQLYYNGGYTGMTTDLTSEGIALPNNVTVYAHRGYGIGTTYNVFLVISSPKATYTVAILTDKTGSTADAARANSAPIISELLSAINVEMERLS